MNKFLLSIAFVFAAANINAQSFNTQQKQLVSQISSYLSGQGYSADKQNNGVNFKDEGVNYYIEVSKEDKSPMFLRLCRYVEYSETIKEEVVVKNLNEYNAKLGIKVYCMDGGLVISSEMYVASSSEFTGVFPTLLNQMKAMYEQINNQ